MSYSINKGVSFLRLCSLSFPKVHAGYPNKNNTTEKGLGERAKFTLYRIAFRAFLCYLV